MHSRKAGYCSNEDHSLSPPHKTIRSTLSKMSSSLRNFHLNITNVRHYPVELYRKAPTSVLTIASMLLSYVIRLAIEDYRLFKALGQGGLGKPSIFTWLIHTIILRPLSLPKRASFDPNCFPLDDEEWKGKKGSEVRLKELPKRQGERPLVFGVVPQRQLSDIAKQNGEMQKAVIEHLHQINSRFNDATISLALSTYESTDSPCLFIGYGQQSSANPTTMARFYLESTPAPHKSLPSKDEHDQDSVNVLKRDPHKHELVHIHLSEGSLHCTLSPQDSRKVVESGYGERHRLAGIGYRANYFPPYWLPGWFYNMVGGERNVRWSYQQKLLNRISSFSSKADKSAAISSSNPRLVPPTYTCIYAPTNEEQLRWTLRIIDSSVAWALGQVEI